LHENGEHEAALRMLCKSCAMREYFLGEEHEEMALCYDSIGLKLLDKGDYDGALVEQRKIGEAQAARGDYNKALLAIRKALDARYAKAERNDKEIVTVHHSIAQVLLERGHFEAPMSKFTEALSICEYAWGQSTQLLQKPSTILLLYFTNGVTTMGC
jgi:tetratricopeptide (TPR) repeat protein